MNENDTKERPEWFAGKVLNEVLFCGAFLEQHSMVRVGGSFFTKEGE